MQSKDCDNTTGYAGLLRIPRKPGRVRLATSVVVVVCAFASDSHGATVRLWSSAVIVNDTVRISDLCELVGFTSDTAREVGSILIAAAPRAGGSRLVHMDMVRKALVQGGVNMAKVNLRGATRCAVSRPIAGDSTAVPVSASFTSQREQSVGGAQPSDLTSDDNGSTLRRAVIDYFNNEFARYGGKAEVVFDRTSEDVLDLRGPTFDFNVRRRRGSPLGLTPLEVDVISGGAVVQTVPLVVQVSMAAQRVVAGRPINQGATIRGVDVDVISSLVDRLDRLGFADVSQVIGHRAKKFLPLGTLISPEMLEAVPFVRRGELVKLSSVAGAVRIVTTARAATDGALGDVITVRAADDKRVEFDAVVVGPGRVQLGVSIAPGKSLVDGGRR